MSLSGSNELDMDVWRSKHHLRGQGHQIFSTTVHIIVNVWLRMLYKLLKTMSHVLKCLFLAQTDKISMSGGQNIALKVRDVNFFPLQFK